MYRQLNRVLSNSWTHLAAVHLSLVVWLLWSSSSPHTRWQHGALSKHMKCQCTWVNHAPSPYVIILQILLILTIFVSSSTSWIDWSFSDRTSKLSQESDLRERGGADYNQQLVLVQRVRMWKISTLIWDFTICGRRVTQRTHQNKHYTIKRGISDNVEKENMIWHTAPGRTISLCSSLF